jgi:hypothetical protein
MRHALTSFTRLRYRQTCSATPPHFRPDYDPPPRPLQNEYPVWYFLTGSLSKPAYLGKLLKLGTFAMTTAWVRGLVETKERQCTALFRATPTDTVTGCAYLVKSEEEEDRLRYFKTDFFHVARCRMTMLAEASKTGETEVDALTFISSYEVSVFRDMNNMPIAKQPGAVGSARKPTRKGFVPPKLKPTTALSFGIPADATSSTPIPVNKEGIWWKEDTVKASAVGGTSRTPALLDTSTLGDDVDTSYYGASSQLTEEVNPGAATASTMHQSVDPGSPLTDPENVQPRSDKGKGKIRADSPPDTEDAQSKPDEGDVPQDAGWQRQRGHRRTSARLSRPSSALQSPPRWTTADDLRAMYAASRSPPPKNTEILDHGTVEGISFQAETGTAAASEEEPFADPAEEQDPFEEPNISRNF